MSAYIYGGKKSPSGNEVTVVYVKAVDEENEKVEMTENYNEAKLYPDSWWASTELDWLKFHFKEQLQEVRDLTVGCK